MLGDAGYDSNIIRDKLQKIKIGKLITPKNIRNCKNPILLKKTKLPDKDKILLLGLLRKPCRVTPESTVLKWNISSHV